MEPHFDAMLYLGTEYSDGGHIKRSRAPQVPYPWSTQLLRKPTGNNRFLLMMSQIRKYRDIAKKKEQSHN